MFFILLIILRLHYSLSLTPHIPPTVLNIMVWIYMVKWFQRFYTRVIHFTMATQLWRDHVNSDIWKSFIQVSLNVLRSDINTPELASPVHQFSRCWLCTHACPVVYELKIIMFTMVCTAVFKALCHIRNNVTLKFLWKDQLLFASFTTDNFVMSCCIYWRN